MERRDDATIDGTWRNIYHFHVIPVTYQPFTPYGQKKGLSWRPRSERDTPRKVAFSVKFVSLVYEKNWKDMSLCYNFSSTFPGRCPRPSSPGFTSLPESAFIIHVEFLWKKRIHTTVEFITLIGLLFVPRKISTLKENLKSHIRGFKINTLRLCI